MAVLAATAALTAKQLLLLSMHSWVLTQEQCNSVLTARLLLLLVGSVRHRQPAATTTTPAKPSKEAPELENRSTWVETASCKSTHLHMIRKKISTVTAQSNKQAAKSFFVNTYFIGLCYYRTSSSHGQKMSSATLHQVPTVACRYLLFTAVSGGPH